MCVCLDVVDKQGTHFLGEQRFERGFLHRDEIVLGGQHQVQLGHLGVVAFEQVQQGAAHALHVH